MEKKVVEKKKVSALNKFIIGFFSLIVIVGLGFGIYWFYQTTTYVSMDNTKISGDILNVSPKTAGKVSGVKVTPGTRVKKGDVLYTLETDQIQIQLSQAEAALDVAKTQLAKVVGGASAQEIAGTQAMVDQAQAGTSAANIGKSNLQSSLNTLQSNYNDLLSKLSSFKDTSGNYSSSAAIGQLDSALAHKAITDAQYTLKVQGIEGLFSLKPQLESQISQLQGQIKLANTQISASNAGTNAAASKLNLTKAGATDKDLQILKDQVKISQSNYDLAKLNLDNTKVKAPIDGTVVQVSVLVGDTSAPGQGAVSIVDLSKLTAIGDVKEASVGKVKVGQSVTLSMDELPGVTFEGKVSEINYATATALNPLANMFASSSSDSTVSLPVKVSFTSQGKDIKVGVSAKSKINIKSK